VNLPFLIITVSVVTLTTRIVLLVFYDVSRNEKSVPIVGVCSINSIGCVDSKDQR